MTEAAPTTCHPATAWALMKRGMDVHQVAARYGDIARELDAAIWVYRAAATGSVKPIGLTTMQALSLRNLAPHDKLAADRFRERA